MLLFDNQISSTWKEQRNYVWQCVTFLSHTPVTTSIVGISSFHMESGKVSPDLDGSSGVEGRADNDEDLMGVDNIDKP